MSWTRQHKDVCAPKVLLTSLFVFLNYVCMYVFTQEDKSSRLQPDFYHGPDGGQWSWRQPNSGNDIFNLKTRSNMFAMVCKHCGLVKISRHLDLGWPRVSGVGPSFECFNQGFKTIVHMCVFYIVPQPGQERKKRKQ